MRSDMNSAIKLRNQKVRTDEQGRICLNDIWASGNFTESQKAHEWWRGNAECKEATGRTAANVRFAIDREIQDRQRRLVR